MSEWIPVSERLPAVGSWANVVRDVREDSWTEFYANQYKQPLVTVHCAQLRHIDQEGYALWQQGELASGHALKNIDCVTHWMPLPEPPKG